MQRTLVEDAVASLDTRSLVRVVNTSFGVSGFIEDSDSGDENWIFTESRTRPRDDEDVVYGGSVAAEVRRPDVAGPAVQDAAETPPGGSVAAEVRRPGVAGPAVQDAAETLQPGGSVEAEDRRPGVAGPAVENAVRRSLELNRHMQRMCREQLALVDESLYCNSLASEAIPELGDSSGSFAPAPGATWRETREHGMSAFGVGERVPAASRDAELAAALREAVPYGTDIPGRPGRWTRQDREKLRQAVAFTVLSVRLRRLLDRARDGSLGDAALHARERVRNLHADAEALSDSELCELLNDAPPLDWFELARIHMPYRSAFECEARWQTDDPRALPFPSERSLREKVRKVPFSEAEELDLERLVQAQGVHAWDDVARQMSLMGHPGRGPMACFRYYKTVVLPRRVASRKAWTHEEDELLGRAVECVGDSNWQRVAELINWVATPDQCLQRWRFRLEPSIRKGDWEAAEDELLRQAVSLCVHPITGNVIWTDVGDMMKETTHRTQVQCRERWVNRLDPSLLPTGTAWSADEDVRLQGAVALLGPRWAAVQRHANLDGRTAKAVTQRWVQLNPAQRKPRPPRQRKPPA